MFAGVPEGNYDRLLDVSRAVTGILFFVPPAPLLESLADVPAKAGSAARPAAAPAAATGPDGAGELEIGSLRGASQDE